MLIILIMIIKIRDYDDNADNKNDDDGDVQVPVIHAVQVVLGGAVGGARFFTFLEDNHGPGDHDYGGQDN